MIEQRKKLIEGEGVCTSTLRSKKHGRKQLMQRRKQLVMDAMSTAIQVRQSFGSGLWNPINPYDLAEQLGVEVRFVDITSMEGMYCKAPKPHILLSSHRPLGRQAFNCSHEL